MIPDYDVIVVGARVAGSPVAMLLARAGRRVLLVDRAGPPADTLSTHALMPTAVLQLHRWGVLPAVVEAGTPPIRKITLGFGDERIGFPYGGDHGVEALYAPRRTLLDRLLLDEARRNGAAFLDGSVVAVVRQAGRVAGIKVRTGGRIRTITASFVVGADGMRSRVAAEVEAPLERWHRPGGFTTYGYYEGLEASGYEFQFTPGAAAGLVPTNDGLTLVYAGQAGDRRSTDVAGQFDATLVLADPAMAARVAGATRIGRFHHSRGIPGFLRTPAGPGWFLVGDAGFTKDFLTAHGISCAFRDAELAALAIGRALADPTDEVAAAAWYRTTRNRVAEPLLDESELLSGANWSAAEASMSLRRLSAIGDEECEMLAGLRSPIGGSERAA